MSAGWLSMNAGPCETQLACLTNAAGATGQSNKELKLTKPCTIGASQLNSSVRRTEECAE